MAKTPVQFRLNGADRAVFVDGGENLLNALCRGVGDTSLIAATRIDESMPPLRNAPTSTSLFRQRRTVSSSVAASVSAARSNVSADRSSLRVQ